MLLRTRLTLYISLAFVLLVVSLIFVGLRREALLDQRMQEVAITGQASLWQRFEGEEVEHLREETAKLAAQLNRRPPPRDEEGLRSWLEAAGQYLIGPIVEELQVVSPAGRLIFTSAPRVDAGALIDVATVERIIVSRQAITGLVQASPTSFMVINAFPLTLHGRVFGVVVLARDAIHTLRRFSQAVQAPSFLVSLRGQLVTGTSPFLWQNVKPEVPPRDPSFTIAKTDRRFFSVIGLPVDDYHNRIAGTLVSLRDSTEQMEEAEWLGEISLAVVGGFVLLVLVGIYFYLRQSFRPLENAIAVLRALSKGNTSVRVDSRGTGEIGRIAEAVAIFRRDASALAAHRQQVDRQRRRQERLIRREMESLAATLDTEGRVAVLRDLRRIVDDQESGGDMAPARDHQLGTLAAVLQTMSTRIADQQHRLTELVAELREAIETRAKLAGLQQELEIARELQVSILPSALPPRDDLAVAGLMRAAKEVGGDFYDFFLLDDGRLAIVMADVSGKGVPAALFMIMTRTLLKATSFFAPEPAECIRRLNNLLAEENEQMMFVTLFYGILDPKSGRLDYVNAGHNPPYVRHLDGSVAPLERAGDMAIAVMEGFDFTQLSTQLAPGELLLLYTDGVTEAFNPEEQAFGEERLEAALTSIPRGLPIPTVLQTVTGAVDAFAGSAPQSDDLTLLALRWLKPKA